MPNPRLVRHDRVSTALALLSDDRLAALVDAAIPAGTGIGGQTATLDVDGVPVFLKQVPLTDLERRPGHVHRTANVFGLPQYYQYGVGSTGFGAWRELAAHVMTTNWVLAGRHPGFPLLHHWRVLPRRPAPAPPADLEEHVAYWDNSDAVRQRRAALDTATAGIALFLERIPHTVSDWLTARLHDDPDRACTMVAEQLAAGVAFMNANGLLHFDAHLRNLLTDGRRLYFADFGLALHERFELTAPETEFLRRHESYDRRYTTGHLTTWLAAALAPGADHDELVRACTTGVLPAPLRTAPPVARRLLLEHATTAMAMNDFFTALVKVSKHTPYPFASDPPGDRPSIRPLL